MQLGRARTHCQHVAAPNDRPLQGKQPKQGDKQENNDQHKFPLGLKLLHLRAVQMNEIPQLLEKYEGKEDTMWKKIASK